MSITVNKGTPVLTWATPSAFTVANTPASADDATRHHFTGKERDTESGNDYFEARYYVSGMGRFMSADWSAQAELFRTQSSAILRA